MNKTVMRTKRYIGLLMLTIMAGTVSYLLAPGIYIVRAGGVTRKVRV